MKKNVAVVILVVLALTSGFLRDSFFVHLNAQIGVAHGNYEQFHLPFLWRFIEGLKLDTLLTLKWIFTLIFFTFYLSIGLLMVKWLFPLRKYFFITFAAFGGVLILSTTAILFGKLNSSFTEPSYYFARWLMGAAQSPLLIMILALLFYADKHQLLRQNK